MTKEEQLKKNKKENPKRMSKYDLDQYKSFIFNKTGGTCQMCGGVADDFHHSRFGRQGADKDDRSLVAVCRKCHTRCHQEKNGTYGNEAIKIGDKNWGDFNI